MEMINIALALSILGTVISVSNFVLSRKDKAIKDKEETDNECADQKLISYRLDKVEEKLDKILDKLDNYDKEINDIVANALEQHIKIYHKGEK